MEGQGRPARKNPRRNKRPPRHPQLPATRASCVRRCVTGLIPHSSAPVPPRRRESEGWKRCKRRKRLRRDRRAQGSCVPSPSTSLRVFDSDDSMRARGERQPQDFNTDSRQHKCRPRRRREQRHRRENNRPSRHQQKKTRQLHVSPRCHSRAVRLCPTPRVRQLTDRTECRNPSFKSWVELPNPAPDGSGKAPGH